MPSALKSLGWTAALLLSAMLPTRVARADAAQSAAAEALFEEARQLVATGRHAEACTRFEESQRLDPAIGTQYNLADCYEKTGRIASAWAAFLDASYSARQAGQADRERAAKERAQALAPRIPKLVITAPAELVEAIRVTRDGVLVGKGQWGTAVPLDPGSHRVVATAPGKRDWETTVRLAETATVTLAIPPLQDVPRPAAGPPSPEAARGSNARTTSAVFLGVVGLAGLTVGSIYGLTARSRNDESMSYCSDKTLCSQEGVDLRERARGDAAISTVAFSIAGAAIVGSVVLWATSPRETAKDKVAGMRVVASPAPGQQLRWEGAW